MSSKSQLARLTADPNPAAFITVPRVGGREGWEHLGPACSGWQGPEPWHRFAKSLPPGLVLLLWHREAQPLLPSSPRLIKGDGEVLEEIVTKERHREINKVGVTPLPGVHTLLWF